MWTHYLQTCAYVYNIFCKPSIKEFKSISTYFGYTFKGFYQKPTLRKVYLNASKNTMSYSEKGLQTFRYSAGIWVKTAGHGKQGQTYALV